MNFSDVITLLASGFRQVFLWLKGFNLIGTFSLLDFLIAAMVIDMIITALFVTFNVSVSDTPTYDKLGNQTGTRKTTRGSARIGR